MISPGFFRRVAVAFALAVLPGAAAQDEVQYGDQPSAPAPGSEQVAIRVETFGVGEVVRAGEWAAIRLALTDRADKPREVAVRLHLKDGDGDTILHTRIVTLNPGREMGVWLYARMPWDLAQGFVLPVSVSEAQPQEDGSVLVGRQIGWKPITAPRIVDATDAMLGVIGNPTLGFEQYAVEYQDRETSPGAHEANYLLSGITPQVLPDVWTGLAAFEAILWTQGDPASLPGEMQAGALREWINRGGHLIVVLPDVGNTWGAAANPLADLMPVCKIDKLEDVDLSGYAMLLSGKLSEAPLRGSLHRFTIPPDTTPTEATPLITGPHGVIAIRRLVGTGMVTLIGLDLDDRRLQQNLTLRADVFWPRILGKRAAALSQAEIGALAAKKINLAGNPPTMRVDDRIATSISKGREAGFGVLLGLIVFVIYWVLAGPVGFSLLRARGLERHSWALFVAAAVCFTAVAWAGASFLRPKTEQAWHYTLLDHVYGQPVERVRSFVSVLLPEYGEQRVTLGEAHADKTWRQALSPWSDPAADSRPAFPDARSYESDVRDMTSLTVPARSTIKTFQADWLGGPRWSMPAPTAPDQAPALDAAGRLSGALVHNLPGPLAQVRILLVRRQAPESTLRYQEVLGKRPLVAEVYAWAPPEKWEPGVAMPLTDMYARPDAAAGPMLEQLLPMLSIMDQALPASTKDEDLDDMVSLFGVLEQPDPGASGFGAGRTPAVVHRRMIHTLDLAEWFTQPCLIVIGRIEDGPLPMPMDVDGYALDGRTRPCQGRTVVRWIYPLTPAPLVVGGGPGTAF